MTVRISEECLQDVINLHTGLLHPLTGFMGGDDFRSVLESCTLADGRVFTLPITLDVPEAIWRDARPGQSLGLEYRDRLVAELVVEDKFRLMEEDLQKIFLTQEDAHPGVHKEKLRSPWRVGGDIRLLDSSLLADALTPEATRKMFAENGWKSVVGFQTRNPIHRAHEYLQRLGLDICDGLFINPITGWKKTGDFTEDAVMAAYRTMITKFYPSGRVYLAGLKTQMRYAGPREAIFHAIIRRNLGCTHFIIGRDHAGVGGYYGPYAAHELARKLLDAGHDPGISLLLAREPYYCRKCGQVVTDRHCSHYSSDRVEISGTLIRKYITDGHIPNELMMRREVFQAILSCRNIFITGSPD